MKTNHLKLAFLSATLTLALPASAQLTIPGADGSDGVLNISSNTVVDLSLAVPAVWNVNNAAHAGKGVYDSNKWAVVFKYSSVSIAAGASLTFVNHPSRAPVVWLVSGNVTIDGTLSLNGQNFVNAPNLAEPGPGGFRGGTSYFAQGASASAGFGPGGGGFVDTAGYAGSYGSLGEIGSSIYGNPSLLPLIGGSGGGGDPENRGSQFGGGGGGGAVLIATAQTLAVNGLVRANGGNGRYANSIEAGGGSGGAIRLVANNFAGNGTLQATGGSGWAVGGLGRIRIERVSNTSTLQITPDASIVALQSGSTPLIWLPESGPTARVVSIGGLNAPSDPRASFDAFGPDVAIPQTTNTVVVVETTNVEPESQVIVRVTPRANGNFREAIAASPTVITPNPLVIQWTANVAVNPGNSAVQVRVKRP